MPFSFLFFCDFDSFSSNFLSTSVKLLRQKKDIALMYKLLSIKITWTTVALMLIINNCNCEFSFVIIVHYDETEQIELKMKSASEWSKGFVTWLSFASAIFASGVKNRTVICKNIFRCLVEMMRDKIKIFIILA